MTYQSTKGAGFFVGPYTKQKQSQTTIPSYTQTLIDSDGEYLTCIFISPVTDSITKIRVHTSTVTTGGDVDFRIETVDANFERSGTLASTNSNYVHTFNSTDDNVSTEITLTSAASLTAGTAYAIVAVRPTGSAFAGNIRRASGMPLLGIPVGHQYIGGSLTYVPSPLFVPTFSTNGLINIDGLHVYNTGLSETLSTGTTPDVVGNIFNLPFDCKVDGCFVELDADGESTIKLLGSDGSTVLASHTISATIIKTTSSAELHIPFTSEISLTANTNYYLVIDPSTTTSVGIHKLSFQSSAIRATQEGCNWCYKVSAKDPTGSGNYTADETTVYHMGLKISSIDIPTGGGGLASNPVGGFVA